MVRGSGIFVVVNGCGDGGEGERHAASRVRVDLEPRTVDPEPAHVYVLMAFCRQLVTFHTSSPCPISYSARWRDARTQVPGHLSSPFRRSFDAELLARVTFHTSSPVRSLHRDGATPRDTRPKALARLQKLFIRCHAVRQMNVPQ